jgi:uncharacterized membrane protein
MIDLQEVLDYFLYPTKTGYTFEKTLVFALVFVSAIYLIFLLLKKMKIKIDRRLALAIAPYVAFGGVLRVVEDLGMISSYWFVTPGIYFLVLFIVIFAMLFSMILEKKFRIPYFKTLFLLGLLSFSFLTSLIVPSNLYGFILVSAFYLPWIVLFFVFKKWGLTNRITALVQLFDATATSVAMKFFGYGEQHVLPSAFINLVGDPFSFVVLKVVGIVLALVLIDKFSDDKEFNTYLKLCIAILGGATGTRDFTCLLTFCKPS